MCVLSESDNCVTRAYVGLGLRCEDLREVSREEGSSVYDRQKMKLPLSGTCGSTRTGTFRRYGEFERVVHLSIYSFQIIS